jgi:uncharacterized protein YndB with AHSA1/START domain
MSVAEMFVRKEILIDVAAEHAFSVFTANQTLWWPAEHHIGKSAMKKVVLEPRAGGRWYEICEDGSECDWGKVLAWDPPRRLVLAWQIDGDWRFDPNFVTEVEVTFVAQSPKRTLVTLHHRNLERFGVKQEEMRKAFESEDGWPLGLGRFARAAETGSPA